jgi:hypothetical protein
LLDLPSLSLATAVEAEPGVLSCNTKQVLGFLSTAFFFFCFSFDDFLGFSVATGANLALSSSTKSIMSMFGSAAVIPSMIYDLLVFHI